MSQIAILTQSLAILVVVVACAGPSERKRQEIKGPDGVVYTCFEPPPSVMTSEVVGAVDASFTEVVELLEANISIESKYERIREELPELQAFEVLEFRLCVARANGSLGSTEYQEFLAMVPFLSSGSPALSTENAEE